jgi:hypothetical protein
LLSCTLLETCNAALGSSPAHRDAGW